jgi:hypothetical protein
LNLGLVQTIIDSASTGLRRLTSGSLEFNNEHEWLQPRHASNTEGYWLHRGVPILQEPTMKRRRLDYLESVCFWKALADHRGDTIDFPEAGWAGNERYEKWIC